MINRARVGIMPLKLPGSQQENISFLMTGARTKIIPSVKGGNISITLEVKAEGNVGDVEDPVPVARPEEIKKLNKLVADNIKQLIEDTVHKTQNMEADIFGFGEVVHRKYPREWNKIEKEWRKIYSDVPVEVKVEAKIRETGMISNPISVEKEGE